jgi:hypothetical protein
MNTINDYDDVITLDGAEMMSLTLGIEDRHPRFAEDTVRRPCFTDEVGNLLHLDECPDCQGWFLWCIDGPNADRVRYSARLMHLCIGER